MLVTTGWPQGLKPEQRIFMIGWFLQNTPEVVQWMTNRGLLDASADHTSLPSQFWFNVLQQDPVTVPQGEWFSAMTMLNFKAWDLRGAFLKKWGGPKWNSIVQRADHTYFGETRPCFSLCPPVAKKARGSPSCGVGLFECSPRYLQPRALVLWRTLTVMAPEAGRDFKPDHTAWARVYYEEVAGRFTGRLELTHELHNVLQSLRPHLTHVRRRCGRKSGMRSFGALSGN